VNAHADDAPAVVHRLVTRWVEDPRTRVVAVSVATGENIRDWRNGIQVEVGDLPTLEQVALDLRRQRRMDHRFQLGGEEFPATDFYIDGMGVGVQLPGHDSFPAERSNAIDAALRDTALREGLRDDFDAFRRLTHERLRAAGVSPTAPHTQIDPRTQLAVPMFSPERRLWLQAEGSATSGYHLHGYGASAAGDTRFSPAGQSTALGAGLGLLLSGGSILLNPQDHPHLTRDLVVATWVGAGGGYLGGQAEFALNARWAPAELTRTNAPFTSGLRGMILPRILSGGIAGAVTAPLITWTVMGVDQAFYGADHTAGDYVVAGARSAVGGGVGAGTAALSIYLLGGLAAGSWVPILGSVIGAVTGLGAYVVVDHFLG
jgi:hypothetical protein